MHGEAGTGALKALGIGTGRPDVRRVGRIGGGEPFDDTVTSSTAVVVRVIARAEDGIVRARSDEKNQREEECRDGGDGRPCG